MREKKFILNWYQTNDTAAMERKLEKMAEKGWLLETVNNWGWRFRRGEPRTVRYTITFFPDASVFDARPIEGQETYADYCRAAGWEFVSAYGPMQFFRSTRPDPIPIETDEGEKLRAVHKSMLKTWVLSYGLLLAVWLLNLFVRLRDFRYQALSLISSNSPLFFLVFLTGFVVYLAAFLLDYFLWYFRSKKAVEQGECCLQPHTRARFWASMALLALCAAMALATVSEASSLGTAWILAYAFCGMVLIMALSQGLLALMKRRGFSRGAVRGAFIAAAAVLAVMYAAGLVPLMTHLRSAGLMEARKPVYTYTGKYGWSWDIYRDDIPLTLEELGYAVTQADHCSYEKEESRSLLADYASYSQYAAASESGLPGLSYQVAVIPWGWLRELALGQLLRGYHSYERVDDPRWGAVEVYQEPHVSGNSDYLLLYGDRIVGIDGDWSLTDEQVGIIVRRLAE